jgi:anti-sigma factor ChrR (cupin superfamily)
MRHDVDAATPVVATAEVIADQPWRELPGAERVSYKPLWKSGKSIAGLMQVWPGGSVPTHVHRRSHHHIWVVEGAARVLDRQLEPGSYIHIPAGVEHALGAGPDGCTVLYLYLRETP